MAFDISAAALAVRDEAARQIQAALDDDAAAMAEAQRQLAAALADGNTKAAEIVRLKARIAELEKPVDPPPPPPPPVDPEPTTFNPRTMTLAQIQAATGLQMALTSQTKRSGSTLTKPGTYENIWFTSRVTVQSNGGKFLFKNCRFDGGNDDYAFISAPERGAPDEIRFEYCDVVGGVNGIAGANLYIWHCDISEWENGVNFWGPGQLVESYIHDQKQHGSEPHFDGIECNGGGNIKILRNYIVNGANQTAALMFNNYFSALSNIEVDGNYLAGGGYTIYFDTSKRSQTLPVPNAKVTNNTVKKGFWGWTALYNSGVRIDAAGGNALVN